MRLRDQRFSFWKVFWVVLAVYAFFHLLGILGSLTASPEKEPGWKYYLNKWHLVQQSLNVAFGALFFYFTLNIFHRYMVEKKSFFYFFRFSIIAAIAFGLYLLARTALMSRLSGEPERMNQRMMIFSSTIFTIFHVLCALILAYFHYLRDERKQRKILEEQKMQLEVEKSSANLNFLKAQINPHFLHNTLNFLYAKSLPYSPELSEGILTLSDIMRYALSEGNAKNGMAPLKDEIEHVWNVIKINQLRFSNKLNVDFTVTGLVDGITIIPFVLITIVENAFKHGDLKDQEHPIEIKLLIDNNRLRFTCANKKKTGPKELSTGVGLENIKKRLELAYGSGYKFDVKDEAGFYKTELNINL